MAITYPLTFPTYNGKQPVKEFTMRLVNRTVLQKSPFTNKQTVINYGHAWYEAEIKLSPLTGANAKNMSGFLQSLRGVKGTFKFTVPFQDGTGTSPPQGNVLATVTGAHTAGNDGLTLTITNGTVAVGQQFNIGDHLYTALQSRTTGTSGTIEITPPLREALSGGETIDFTDPFIIFRLAENETDYKVGVDSVHEFSIAVIEAI